MVAATADVEAEAAEAPRLLGFPAIDLVPVPSIRASPLHWSSVLSANDDDVGGGGGGSLSSLQREIAMQLLPLAQEAEEDPHLMSTWYMEE